MITKTIGFVIFFLFSSVAFAQTDGDGLGQTIQIYTQLHSFVGKPTWLLIIRDVDHGQIIPYLYDIRRGDNTWLAFTYSRNYLISVSNLQFSPYRRDPFRSKKINNFCHLESQGQIIHGESMMIRITGDLSPNTHSFRCIVTRFPDTSFIIVNHNGE